MTSAAEGITQLLYDWRGGNESALDNLIGLVYDDLRRLARGYLRGERRGHTLQTGSLINETYMRLLGQQSTDWQDRAHFFVVTARIMRHLLIDHARTRGYAKRNAEHQVTLHEWSAVTREQSCDLLALNESLERLAAIDPRKATVVELRYFAGLNLEEMAALLGVSPATISRDQKMAEAWLSHAMSSD
jgi:RNA polymerase sigma factor (TIGR02999 family)